MEKFKIIETDEELVDRILNLTDKQDYGIFCSAMNAQTALYELSNFFLGEDWYATEGCSTGQVNTEIVMDIERKFKWYRIIRRAMQWVKMKLEKFMK